MMWGFDGGSLWPGFGRVGGLSIILWWAVIIGGIFALVRWIAVSHRGSHGSCCHGEHGPAGEDAATSILKERYA